MKKIILGVLLIILIVVGIFVFSVVRSFNVDVYKKQVISTLEQLTGRHVACAEQASLSWRPKPTFIMHDLLISNQDGSSTPNMLSVKQVQVEMDWSSFLSPSLVIKKVILKDPNLLVERLHTYQTNFAFPYLFNPEQSLENEAILENAGRLIVDVFEVENGTITYHNDITSDTFVLKQISGKGHIDSLEGPFAFEGTVQAMDMPVNIELNANKLAVSQPVTGSLIIKTPVGGSQVDMSYSLSSNRNEDWLLLEGKYAFQSPVEFFEKFSNLKWPDLGELKGYFKWSINPQNNTLKEMVLVQGEEGNAVSCNILLKPDDKTKEEKLNIVMDHLDYALWQPVLERLFQSVIVKVKGSEPVDISIQQITLNQQNIADILVQGQMNNGFFVGTATAKLPFDTSFSLNGQWQPAQNALGGELTLQTQDLSALTLWGLNKQNLPWLPSSEKITAQLNGKIDLSETKQKIDIQMCSMDQIQISGQVEKSKEILVADLDIKNFNMDNYYPALQQMNNKTIQDWLFNTIKDINQLNKKGKINLNLSNFTLLSHNLDQIDFQGSWTDNMWDISKFDIQKESEADIKFSGQIRQLGAPDFTVQKSKLDVNIPQWEMWYNLFAFLDIYENLKQFSSVSAVIDYSGNLAEGQVNAETTLDKIKFSASGKVYPQHQSFDKLHVILNHSDFTQLMKIIVPTQTLTSEWALPVDFDGILSKDAEKFSWENVQFSLGKNTLTSNGQWHPNLLNLKIQAKQMPLDMIFPPINALNTTIKTPFSDFDSNVRLDVALDKFTYGSLKGEQLKLKADSENKKWKITALDCLLGDEQPGRLSVDGTIDTEKSIIPNLHLQWDKIRIPRDALVYGPYHFSQGDLSGNATIQSNGSSWATLMNNATGQGRMIWNDGILHGMDASAWLTAVQSALAAEQMGQAFSSSLQYALTNGKTQLPTLEGTFVMNKGFLNFSDVQGANDLITISGGVIEWAMAKEATHVKMPVILTAISKLPSIVFDFNYNAYSVQSIPFEKSFDEELHLKKSQSLEARQLQDLKAIEIKNQQMRSEAQNIMNNMEQTLKQLQERVALRSDPSANEKLDQLNYTAREIRDLAVKVDLTPMEYTALLEKARLWSVQVSDLNNFYARQDLLSQKLKTNQLSPLVTTYLADIEQIYQQHPQSVILAEIVMNSRQVVKFIKDDEAKLSSAQDAQTVESLVIRIQDNFDKIEKAHQYAQKLHLSMVNGGVSL